jgi:hypothetical protein
VGVVDYAGDCRVCGIEPAWSVGLTGTLLTVFLSGVKPVTQNGERLGLDLEERKAAPEIGLHVNNFRFGLEEIFTGKNFYEDERVLRERIHHVKVAAVKAKLADASGDAYIRLLLDEFCAGDEGVAWRAALFSFQEDRPLKL